MRRIGTPMPRAAFRTLAEELKRLGYQHAARWSRTAPLAASSTSTRDSTTTSRPGRDAEDEPTIEIATARRGTSPTSRSTCARASRRRSAVLPLGPLPRSALPVPAAGPVPRRLPERRPLQVPRRSCRSHRAAPGRLGAIGRRQVLDGRDDLRLLRRPLRRRDPLRRPRDRPPARGAAAARTLRPDAHRLHLGSRRVARRARLLLRPRHAAASRTCSHVPLVVRYPDDRRAHRRGRSGRAGPARAHGARAAGRALRDGSGRRVVRSCPGSRRRGRAGTLAFAEAGYARRRSGSTSRSTDASAHVCVDRTRTSGTSPATTASSRALRPRAPIPARRSTSPPSTRRSSAASRRAHDLVSRAAAADRSRSRGLRRRPRGRPRDGEAARRPGLHRLRAAQARASRIASISAATISWRSPTMP